MSTEDRITELEIQLTHQDDTIAELNNVILIQQKTIDVLESRLQKIESEIKSITSTDITNASEEPLPPHY